MSHDDKPLDFDEQFVGSYISGAGKASKASNLRPHEEVFRCPMHGTFNIAVPGLNVPCWPISVVNNSKHYRFVIMRHMHGGRDYCGWAIRDLTSHQRISTLEVLTKRRLPETLKQGLFKVRLPQLWSPQKVIEWAKDQYWFQTFEFTPTPRADSKFVWDTINRIDWKDQDVVDFGCHYGYMSLKASALGASVLGVDKSTPSRNAAETIRDHIIQEDVTYTATAFTSTPECDVFLHLSVLHQIDPAYETLGPLMTELKKKTRKHIFLELIMPPTFPKFNTNGLTEKDIDRIVGGDILARYRHKVRGHRKIYHIRVT
jgi:hypothetical protein